MKIKVGKFLIESLDDKTIQILIEKRNNAKKEKNYELADKIREELLKMNVSIKDTREGTIFEII